jgi:hypothetical protein
MWGIFFSLFPISISMIVNEKPRGFFIFITHYQSGFSCKFSHQIFLKFILIVDDLILSDFHCTIVFRFCFYFTLRWWSRFFIGSNWVKWLKWFRLNCCIENVFRIERVVEGVGYRTWRIFAK